VTEKPKYSKRRNLPMRIPRDSEIIPKANRFSLLSNITITSLATAKKEE